LAAVSGLTYHHAIQLPADDDEAAEVLVLSLSLVLMGALIAGALGFFFLDLLGRWERASALLSLLWLVPFGALGIATFESFSQWALRKKYFAVVARVTVIKSAAQTLCQTGAGVLASGPFGL